MRELVLPAGHEVAVAEQDVGRLVHGVGEQQAAHGTALPCGGRDGLGLDGRVPLDLGGRDEAEERQQELVERRDRGVGEDGRAGGVDPGREVVEDDLAHGGAQVSGVVAVGDDLVVGDDEHDLDAVVLQPDAVREGAEVVPEVQRARRAVTGEDAEAGRVGREPGLDTRGPLAGRRDGRGRRRQPGRRRGREGRRRGVEGRGHGALLRWGATHHARSRTGPART
ncbi:Uncharacterised protein [Mycobacteroides abscessus]|nr:Uncharacterised protein [Mycobacteroides abscessus]